MTVKVSAQESLVASDFSTPLILDVLPLKSRILRFRRPLNVHPVLDEETQMLTVEIPKFGILSAGRTRDELLHDLTEDIHARWRLYALKADENLTDGAQRLKDALLSSLEEIRLAAS